VCACVCVRASFVLIGNMCICVPLCLRICWQVKTLHLLWPSVLLLYNLVAGTVYVDGRGPYSGTALGTFQGLDLVEPLYVGGVPDFGNIHRLNGFTQGFVGR
jgi:hypothetical protein